MITFPVFPVKIAQTIMIPPLKVYYSQTHIRYNISTLEKDIRNICDGTFQKHFNNVPIYLSTGCEYSELY